MPLFYGVTREAEQPLWSERHGGKLPLTKEGFATLLVAAFEELRREGVFREVLHLRPTGSYPSLERAEAFFSMNLGDPWAAEAMRNKVAIEYATDDQVFDLIELLHRDAVSVAKPEQMENGQIVQRVQEPFRRLVDQPLPEETPEREVQARVSDAVAHFRRRDATAGDRRAAVRELADVLESIRDDVKEHMLTEDERVLFRFANEFAIRHNKRDTRRDCIRGQSTRHA